MTKEEKYKAAELYQTEHKSSLRAAAKAAGVSYTGFWAWQKKKKVQPRDETQIIVHDVSKPRRRPGPVPGFKRVPQDVQASREDFVFVGRVSDLKALLREMQS